MSSLINVSSCSFRNVVASEEGICTRHVLHIQRMRGPNGPRGAWCDNLGFADDSGDCTRMWIWTGDGHMELGPIILDLPVAAPPTPEVMTISRLIDQAHESARRGRPIWDLQYMGMSLRWWRHWLEVGET